MLRVAALTDAAYEWEHHVVTAKEAGLDEEEVGRVRANGTMEAASIRGPATVEQRAGPGDGNEDPTSDAPATSPNRLLR